MQQRRGSARKPAARSAPAPQKQPSAAYGSASSFDDQARLRSEALRKHDTCEAQELELRELSTRYRNRKAELSTRLRGLERQIAEEERSADGSMQASATGGDADGSGASDEPVASSPLEQEAQAVRVELAGLTDDYQTETARLRAEQVALTAAEQAIIRGELAHRNAKARFATPPRTLHARRKNDQAAAEATLARWEVVGEECHPEVIFQRLQKRKG